jgi:hypothetical protein
LSKRYARFFLGKNYRFLHFARRFVLNFVMAITFLVLLFGTTTSVLASGQHSLTALASKLEFRPNEGDTQARAQASEKTVVKGQVVDCELWGAAGTGPCRHRRGGLGADGQRRHLLAGRRAARTPAALRIARRLHAGPPRARMLSSRRNEVRLPFYSRVDVRANRTFNWSGRRMMLFAEVINLLNRTTYDWSLHA